MEPSSSEHGLEGFSVPCPHPTKFPILCSSLLLLPAGLDAQRSERCNVWPDALCIFKICLKRALDWVSLKRWKQNMCSVGRQIALKQPLDKPRSSTLPDFRYSVLLSLRRSESFRHKLTKLISNAQNSSYKNISQVPTGYNTRVQTRKKVNINFLNYIL